MPRAGLIRHGVIPVVAVAALVLAAGCGSGSGNSSSQNSGKASNVNIAALNGDVTAAASLPTFSTYASNYGGNVPTTGLAGKKIMIIPGVSALAACTEIAQAAAAIATAAGMKATIFANGGTTAEHNTAIENAIHQHYAAIDMGCAVDPSTSAPALKQAEAAGIAVSVYGATPQEAALAGVTYNNVDTYAADAKVAAEQAVAQHGGKPFHALAIVSLATPATEIMLTALKSELNATCPACKLSQVNVEVPNWTTSIASTVTSQLLQNPDVSVMFPFYAGMLTYMLTGIQGAHKTTSMKTYLAFGGGTPFIQLQTTEPGKSIIQSDIGGYPPWTGYLMFLQTARALAHMPPLSFSQAIGPNRVVTPQNADEVLATGGWGTDWVNGFRGLLGLPQLSGAALTAAATLNGAMTGKP